MSLKYAEMTKDSTVKCFFERHDDLVPVFEDHEDYPQPIEVTDRDPEVAVGDIYDRETDTFTKPAPVDTAATEEAAPAPAKKAK